MELIHNTDAMLTTGQIMEISVGGVTQRTMSGNEVITEYINSLKSESTKGSYSRAIYEYFNYIYDTTNLTTQMLITNPSQAGDYAKEMYGRVQTDDENIKIKKSTYNQKIKGVKMFYDWLITKTTLNTVNIKLFNINPFSSVGLVAETDSEGSLPLSPEEIITMLSNPVGTSNHVKERNCLILEIAITTGIRNNALLSITADDIKMIGNDWIIEVEDKGGKVARKPINNYYDRLMKWYNYDVKFRSAKENSGTIFNITPVSANRIIKQWANKCNINKKITFHSLRTTTAVEVFKREENNIYAVQRFLNHSSSNTSMIYVEKEKYVNHDGEDIIKDIKNEVDEIRETFNSKTKEELIEMLMSLDTATKLNLIRNTKN